MRSPSVPDYKPWDIELLADEFLARYWRPSEKWVDIELIIERDLDVLIDYVDAGAFCTLGGLCKRLSDSRFVIVVDEDLADRNPNRYRFTLGQEAGHLILHEDVLAAISTPQEAHEFQQSLDADTYAQMERDVNRFAGAVLLPRREFSMAARETYAEFLARFAEVGARDFEFFRKMLVDQLAKLYQVSAEVVRIRLKHWPIKLYDSILDSAARGEPELPV